MNKSLLWALLWYGTSSALLYYYFSKLSGSRCRWRGVAIYAALSYGFAFLQYRGLMGEFLHVLPGIALLAVCGAFFQKRAFVESLVLSSLAVSVHGVMSGTTESIAFWVASSINPSPAFRFADFFKNVATIALLIFTFRIIINSFAGSLRNIRRPYLLILLAPTLFITFVGAFLSDAVYGDTVAIDTAQGVVFPIVNSMELLSLRLLACVCLFSALFAYRRLTQAIEHEKTIQLLAGQTHNQEVYIKEAKERYEQTRSFRHDIKNHLLIVRQLLLAKNPNAAQEYLEKLEEMSDALSFPIQTGNDKVDALLGSKLAVAAGKGIKIDCTLHIPKKSGVNDTDWCIVLSNAIDNAINASDHVCEQEREIHISSGQKGNLYFLHIENRCPAGTKPPKAGIGLTNICATVDKYNGKVDVEIADDAFKLSALFVIPQHSGSVSRQPS